MAEKKIRFPDLVTVICISGYINKTLGECTVGHQVRRTRVLHIYRNLNFQFRKIVAIVVFLAEKSEESERRGFSFFSVILKSNFFDGLSIHGFQFGGDFWISTLKPLPTILDGNEWTVKASSQH